MKNCYISFHISHILNCVQYVFNKKLTKIISYLKNLILWITFNIVNIIIYPSFLNIFLTNIILYHHHYLLSLTYKYIIIMSDKKQVEVQIIINATIEVDANMEYPDMIDELTYHGNQDVSGTDNIKILSTQLEEIK